MSQKKKNLQGKKTPAVFQPDPVGIAAHGENFSVFMALGIIIGIATVLDCNVYISININELLKEAIALRIFLVLTVIGVLGLLIQQIPWIPNILRNLLQWCSCPCLRAGLSTGSIASGILLGYGAIVAGVAYVFDLEKLMGMGSLSLLISFFCISMLLPPLLFASSLLTDITFNLSLVSAVYSAVAIYLLVNFANLNRMEYLILGTGLVFSIVLKVRQNIRIMSWLSGV